MSCPEGETACPLASGEFPSLIIPSSQHAPETDSAGLSPEGGFECVDTTNSLTACGGCPGPYGPGQDCLAIPGALNVQCADSKCIVGELYDCSAPVRTEFDAFRSSTGSCFRGWRFDASGNGRCE